MWILAKFILVSKGNTISGGSRISRWGGTPSHWGGGGVPTSDVGAFWQKHMRKRKNWILLGGMCQRRPPGSANDYVKTAVNIMSVNS